MVARPDHGVAEPGDDSVLPALQGIERCPLLVLRESFRELLSSLDQDLLTILVQNPRGHSDGRTGLGWEQNDGDRGPRLQGFHRSPPAPAVSRQIGGIRQLGGPMNRIAALVRHVEQELSVGIREPELRYDGREGKRIFVVVRDVGTVMTETRDRNET